MFEDDVQKVCKDKDRTVADWLGVQFKSNKYEDDSHDHYKKVRQEVETFRNNYLETSVKEITDNEDRSTKNIQAIKEWPTAW